LRQGSENDSGLQGMARYWAIYGGWRALFSSAYLWSAVIGTALLTPLWLRGGWWDISLSTLPNLLGFTLGAYALLISFGDERFKAFLIATDTERTTAFMEVSATFFHFIFVQALALMAALLAKAFAQAPNEWVSLVVDGQAAWLGALRTGWWLFGFLLFVYSITLIVAAGLAVFEVSTWFNDHQSGHATRTEDSAQKTPPLPESTQQRTPITTPPSSRGVPESS
jgi:hypothetical protein